MIIMIMIGYAHDDHDGYDVDWVMIERMTDMFMVRVIMEVILMMTPITVIIFHRHYHNHHLYHYYYNYYHPHQQLQYIHVYRFKW